MRVGDPDGHGRYGHLEETPEGLVCHECGKSYKHLATHARYQHGYPNAAAYREAHGLKRTQRMVSSAASEAMRAAWDRNADGHLRRVEASRNVRKAQEKSIGTLKGKGWSPAARAARQKSVRDTHQGRDLTPVEVSRLGDDLTTGQWCQRVWALLDDESVSVPSVARAVGMTPGAIYQRLRRYPRE